ncbi:MAG: AAA family ATPase [Prevotellaceae bacterium]|nr:AAA family ATPase [Prevotellaceae bacterium]
MLPPEDRLVGSQLSRYIKDELYWVLHAPRQTGKTTFLQNWAREINAGVEAVACYVSVERCDRISQAKEAMPAICDAIRRAAENNELPVPVCDDSNYLSMLNSILSNWSELVAPKPLIVLFDEVDVLVDETMVSFLRQLRDGFATRGIGKFPVSIALVGMRDLKDYLIKAKDGKPVNPGSPFNIKEDSAVLSNFSRDDVAKLFALRTEETGQQITQAVSP